MARTVRVFLNTKSGGASGIDQELERLFREAGCDYRQQDLDQQTDLAAALHPGEIAVAAGGDGTVNAVACAAAKTGNTVAVLPVGTLNHFAHDLRLPLDLPDAVRLAARGEPSPVDAAAVNGHLFVNNSVLGLYPAMVLDRDRLKRGGWNKWLSLLWASLRALARFRRIAVELSVDGETHHYTTPFLFVGNNEYCMEGAETGKRVSLTEGTLFLCLAPVVSRFGLLKLSLASLTGRLFDMPEFLRFSTSEFTVHVPGNRRLRVSFDGEVRRLRGPLHYRIRPGVLQVIQPSSPDAA